jgi:putative ABC transport system permease protein
MPVALRIARRELRGGLRGFRIFLACLALGVAAIAGVRSMSTAALEGLRDDGRAILGGDVALRMLYREPAAGEQAWLAKAADAVSHVAEMRAMARRPDGGASTLVELKAVDDAYPLFGELLLDRRAPLYGLLARVGSAWGAVVDDTVLDRLGLSIGDHLLIGEASYEIRALIMREPDRMGGGGIVGLGPRIMVSTDSLSSTGLVQAGSMIYHQYRLRLPRGEDVDAWEARFRDRFPDSTWRVRDYRNAAPRVEFMVERLNLFLTLVGMTALLVGGVGVSNAVGAYLDGKLETIATLKCVGATNQTVFRAYMVQVLVLAGLGVLIGLLIGALTPVVAAMLLREWLPFGIRAGLFPGALGVATAFGLLTTLSFALWPLTRVREVPAGALFRDMLADRHERPPAVYLAATAGSALALASLAIATADNRAFGAWFVGGAALAILLFRVAAWAVMRIAVRLGRPRRPGLRLALSNLYRPGAPTISVVLSLGLGLTVLVAIALIEANMDRQIRESIPRQAPAFFFVDVQSGQLESFSALVESVEGTSELTTVPYLRGRIEAVNGRPAEEALVDRSHEWMIRGDRGLTYSATPPENAEIIAGKWWPADYAGPLLLSVHKDVTEAFDVGVGDRITLNVLGRQLTGTIANVRNLEWRTLQINFAIMLSPEPMRGAPHANIATLVASPEAEHVVQRLVTNRFPNITAVRIKEALETVDRLLRNIGWAVQGVALVTLIAGTLVLAGAIAAGHRRRVHDSVILKVLGATRRDVLRAYLLEYGLLGLITAAIASLVGTVAAQTVITRVMHTDWQFKPAAVLATVVLCGVITLGLGFLGTWRALGQRPAPLLRNE